MVELASQVEFSLADLYEGLTDAGPDDVCLVAGEVRHTRRSLDERANRLAHWLRSRGVGPGDMVGVYSYNRAEYVEAMIATWKIGAVAININYRYVVDELRYVLDDADPVAMIYERGFTPQLDELAADFPRLTTYLVIEDGSDAMPSGFEAERYEAALDSQSPERGFGVPRSADDLYILYTGGTTGMPKGVMWRHEDIFFASFGGGNFYDPITTPDQIADSATGDHGLDALAIAPMMHGGGQWILFIAIFSGGKGVLYTERHFDAHKVLELAAREKVASWAMVGDAMGRPIAEAMADPATDYDLSSLVSVGNGGAMLTKAVKEQLAEAFPNALVTDSFGASETGSAGLDASSEPSTQGPRFTVDENTTVLDDDLRPVEPGSGTRGMLARKGHIPLGYYKDPEKTASTFVTDPAGQRWVIPGDYATVEPDGTVLLFGRGSVSINTGGEKVYPEEVESALRSHPDVYDALVVGVPDERWGQKVVALVEPREGADAPDLDELQAHCRTRIAGYKVPRSLVVGPVERTVIGKPDYVWAAERAAEALGIDREADGAEAEEKAMTDQ